MLANFLADKQVVCTPIQNQNCKAMYSHLWEIGTYNYKKAGKPIPKRKRISTINDYLSNSMVTQGEIDLTQENATNSNSVINTNSEITVITRIRNYYF